MIFWKKEKGIKKAPEGTNPSGAFCVASGL